MKAYKALIQFTSTYSNICITIIYINFLIYIDGDTLRSIQTLDIDVRTSVEIKFALEALTAINNNNYVRFFKVVKKASLLQACILFRYFGQVRHRALETMVKAYCPGTV